jgi:aspartyl-tRNA(Asn)/glutamyl-tRNA(Gln) amidotransferase subunit C
MDQSTLEKVAFLARLKLSDSEAHEFAEQLSNVLKNFEQISRIDTKGVEPLVTPTEITPHWREDIVKKELSAEEIVANAPTRQGNLFSVPPVV